MLELTSLFLTKNYHSECMGIGGMLGVLGECMNIICQVEVIVLISAYHKFNTPFHWLETHHVHIPII